MIENMQTMSEHAKKVLRWRESFLCLEENQFFEIMKMYLGQIKTPYNKQKLISNLEGFLHKKENLVAIKSFLSDAEIEIICAVVFIPNATEEKLVSFFEKTFSYSFLYETVLNLEERLILFKSKPEDLNHAHENDMLIELNPLLEDAIFDVISVERLLPDVQFEKSEERTALITPEFILCFIAYVIENPGMAKQDGDLKKQTVKMIPDFFGGEVEKIAVLYKAFLNLGILKGNAHGVELDWNKLNLFFDLDFTEQIVYIVVSCFSHFSRDSLKVQAQVFLDTVRNVPEKGFSLDLFLRTGFLAASRPHISGSEHFGKTSRFAKILQEGRSRLAFETEDAVNVRVSGGLERMFDAACSLGIIFRCGAMPDGQSVYSVSELFLNGAQYSENMQEMIRIDSGMDVNLMPGFSPKDIVPLVQFLSLKKYDTVSEFSISRQSVMRGFDLGLSADSITEILEKRTSFAIPDSLKIQLEEWNSSYSSASFYKGFVLKVDEKTALAAVHNSVLSPHIHTVIAPGIFLLDVNDDEEALALIKKSGLGFVGKIKSAKEEIQSAGFFHLQLRQEGTKSDWNSRLAVPKEIVEKKDPGELEKNLFRELEKMNLTESQREDLELRIAHKVIVNSSQLNADILRLEKSNAEAMDFSGKVYVVENALRNSECIELRFGASGKKDSVVLGRPVGMRKVSGDTFVQLLLVPENTVKEFSLGKAQFVKRIKKSIY